MARRALIAGNWKMNGLRDDGLALALALGRAWKETPPPAATDLLVCPPATLIAETAAALAGTAIAVGGQDCHPADKGAHTGDIAAPMLADLGCTAVIVGHSERRQDHGEGDALVRQKAEAAHRAGLMAILCVGETADERDAGRALERVGRQVADSLPETANTANTVIAYEPVWAIGSGRTPVPKDVTEIHQGIRHALERRRSGLGAALRVLYGGSVKPENARDFLALADVDGALVGGASLNAADFWAIVESSS